MQWQTSKDLGKEPRFFVRWIFLGGLLLSVLAGCGASTGSSLAQSRPEVTPSPWQRVTITAIDYGYAMPTSFSFQAGLVDFVLLNNGTQPHQAQLARLKPGVTSAQVVDELINKRQEARAFALLAFVGGPDTIAPGDGQETIMNLAAGTYALLCLVTGTDGLPHIDKGMIHFLSVAAAQQAQPMPQESGNLIIQNHQYLVPSTLTHMASTLLRVENRGTVPHEVNIVRLVNGKGLRDIQAFFAHPSGPPPFEEMGGMATLDPGRSGWMRLHLAPGNYALLSAVPEPRSGTFQFNDGLLASVRVS